MTVANTVVSEVEVGCLGLESTTGTGGDTKATVFTDGVDTEVHTDSEPVSSATDVPIKESDIEFEVVHMGLGFTDTSAPTMGSSIVPMTAQTPDALLNVERSRMMKQYRLELFGDTGYVDMNHFQDRNWG